MNQIKCPHCENIITVDESDYNIIRSQIRNAEFESELAQRAKELDKLKEKDIKLLETQAKATLDQTKATVEASNAKFLAELQAQIQALKSQLDQADINQKLAISKMELQKNEEISQLQQKISTSATEKELALTIIESEKKEAISTLEAKLQVEQTAHLQEVARMEETHRMRLKEKEETLEFYKDLKAKQSTKMVGESLELHCEHEFDRLRPTAFQYCQFTKDNDARSGSKGDYIFRDFTPDGLEYISIMFEMKNEMESTAVKKKNQDFFKELDKDRNEKNCEYAVLVSMLESDNDLYNTGIVDVSHLYPKMFVIRPQFFIPMISLLRNAAMNTVQFKEELEILKNQEIDITNFEDNMNSFKEGFDKNYNSARTKFKTAIDEIDKAIDRLNKSKEALLSSENQLRLANDKAEKLTIKKLTKDSPSIAKRLEEAKKPPALT